MISVKVIVIVMVMVKLPATHMLLSCYPVALLPSVLLESRCKSTTVGLRSTNFPQKKFDFFLDHYSITALQFKIWIPKTQKQNLYLYINI